MIRIYFRLYTVLLQRITLISCSCHHQYAEHHNEVPNAVRSRIGCQLMPHRIDRAVILSLAGTLTSCGVIFSRISLKIRYKYGKGMGR